MYASFLDQAFDQRFRVSGTLTLGERQSADLFYATLALELAAHGNVYGFRLECARLRMLESSIHRNGAYLDDVLRLLRLAASKKYIDVALNWMRASGPLDMLSSDARRIIRFRSLPERLRSVELRVLTAAAEVLTEEESSAALDAVLRCLQSDGPPNLPGEWELGIIRAETAWRAAAALSNASGRSDEVAGLLLAESATIDGDQVRDTAVARALSMVDWSRVSNQTRQAWIGYLSAEGSKVPAIVSVAAPSLGAAAMPSQVGRADLEVVATWLNISMRGERINQEVVSSAVLQVREAMRSAQDSARRGINSLGLPVADIAAGLIVYCGATELWPDLVSFLTDSALFRTARSAAFERLAREAEDIPIEVRESFNAATESLLETPDFAFGSGLVPYPEALRLLGSAEIISDLKVMDSVARLAGLSSEGRREAARTVELLSRNHAKQWMLGFAVELIRDEDVETRALAGSCLARLASSSPDIAEFCRKHIIDLLKEDGMLVPTLLLRSLRESGFQLTSDVTSYVNWMRDNHISSTVRRNAMLLLRSET